MAAANPLAAEPVPVPAAAPSPASLTPAAQVAPWWVPSWPVCLAVGLYVMVFWILWMLAPAKGAEASELFKTLAAAIVLTAFVNGVVAAVFTSSRDSQKKNETIAAQARLIASRAPLGPGD